MPENPRSIADLGGRAGDVAALHLSAAFRAFIPEHKISKGEGHWSLVTGAPHPLGNFAVVESATDPHATRAGLAALADCTEPKATIHFSQPSAEVDALLTGAGYQFAEAMPAMAVDIEALRETQLPDGYNFGRLGTPHDAVQWATTLSEGYGLPLDLAMLFKPEVDTADDARCQCFAVYKGDRIVTTSAVVMVDGVAGIYCVATLADERGKGLGAHATAEPLRLAQKLGYGVGVLQSSHDGHSVYQRLGFRDYGAMPLYVNM